MRATLRRFWTNRPAILALGALAALAAFCVFVPILSPHDPYALNFSKQEQPPSSEHWLGTDFFGRDVLVRLALGGRASLLIALGALALVALLGVVYGSLSGLAGGKIDGVMMRALDGMFALPRFAILVSLVAVFGKQGSTYQTLILALAIVNWMTTARLVRGEVVRLKQSNYVRAAHAAGARTVHIGLRHIAPNTIGILIVAVFLELPGLILTESLISAIGLGPSHPSATWGNIAWLGIQEGQLSHVAFVSLGLAIFAISANFIADGFQEALDPRAGVAVAARQQRVLA